MKLLLNKFTSTISLSILYVFLCGVILVWMNTLITNTPITSDAEQNLTMAYNFYKSGVLSTNQPDRDILEPTNYREPLPPTVHAIGMYLHPGINQDTVFESMQNGAHTVSVKQINLFWILVLLIGVGYLTYLVSKNKFLPFLAFLLTITYFIRFGNHFDLLNTELQAATFIIWLTSIFVLIINKPKTLFYAIGGVLMGLLILTKGVFLYLFVIIIPFILYINYQESDYVKSILFILLSILVVGPWLVRNYNIYQEFSLTQRGGAVLHLRAMHNQMNIDEVVGAFNYWGPQLYKDVLRRTPLGAEHEDFEIGGKYERFKMDHDIDSIAVDKGLPDMAVSFFGKSRAEINRLQDLLGENGREAPRYEVYKIMEANSKEMILDQPVKHSLLSIVYLWRGIWCFPNSTIPFVGNSIQLYLHNIINLIAYMSVFGFFIIGIWKMNTKYIALSILPVSMLLIHALLTQNLARFSETAIPSMLVCLSIAIFMFYEKYQKKLIS